MPSNVESPQTDCTDAHSGAQSVTITIPGTLHSDLGPNGRVHHMKRYRLKKELADRAWLATLAAEPITMPTPLTLDVLVAWESKRRHVWDDDNLIGAFKAARDSIAAAIGIDDKYIRVGTVTQVYDDEKRGFIKVAVRHAARPAGAEGQGA